MKRVTCSGGSTGARTISARTTRNFRKQWVTVASIIDNDVHKLRREVGAGARQSEFQDGTKEDETILRGGAFYTWQFSETANFRQDLTIEAGDENTNLVSFSALSASLIGDLALVASFTVKHNTEVPPLTEKTDTYTALSLEYAF